MSATFGITSIWQVTDVCFMRKSLFLEVKGVVNNVEFNQPLEDVNWFQAWTSSAVIFPIHSRLKQARANMSGQAALLPPVPVAFTAELSQPGRMKQTAGASSWIWSLPELLPPRPG